MAGMSIDRVEDYANLLQTCLEAQYNLLPAAVRPANYLQIAGTYFIEDMDPFGGNLCCDGTGWVRTGDTYTSREFPEPSELLAGNSCDPLGWAQQYDIGVARCYPGSGEIDMISKAEHLAASELDRLDLRTIKKALCCFADNMLPVGNLYQITGIAVSPLSGTCISRIASIVVSLGRCC